MTDWTSDDHEPLNGERVQEEAEQHNTTNGVPSVVEQEEEDQLLGEVKEILRADRQRAVDEGIPGSWASATFA
jgi:hypothetical protein